MQIPGRCNRSCLTHQDSSVTGWSAVTTNLCILRKFLIIYSRTMLIQKAWTPCWKIRWLPSIVSVDHDQRIMFNSCYLFQPPSTAFSFPCPVSLQEPFHILPMNPMQAEGWETFIVLLWPLRPPASYGPCFCSQLFHALQVNTARCLSCLSLFIFAKVTPSCWRNRSKMMLDSLGLSLGFRKGVYMCFNTASKFSQVKLNRRL